MDRNDILGVVGISLYGVGAWLVAPAFFFVSTGLIFLSVAIFGAMAPRKGGEKK